MIQYPTQAKELMELALVCMNDEDYAGAIKYANDALAVEKDNNKISDILVLLAECYAMDNNERFSIEILARALSSGRESLQFYVLMIAALIRKQSDGSVINHYIAKLAQIVDKYKVRSESELYFLCNNGGIKINKEIFEDAFEGKSYARLYSADDRARKKIRKASEYMAKQQHQAALETLETIELKGVSKELRVEILNDECVCYMSMGMSDGVKQCIEEALEIDPYDVESLLVKYMLSVDDEMDDVAQDCLDKMRVAGDIAEENMSKIFIVLSYDGRYDDIITIADNQLTDNPDNYIYNKCKAIAAYNLGDEKTAKKIFASMARLYPDMTGAEQYLYYLDNYVDDYELSDCDVEPLRKEWKEYVDTISPDKALSDGRVSDKLRLALRYLTSREFGGRMSDKEIKKVVDLGMESVNEYLLTLLIKEDVTSQSKSGIIYHLALAGQARFCILHDEKFSSIEIKSPQQLKDVGATCRRAYYKAVSYSATLGQQAIDRLGVALGKIMQRAEQKKVVLRSADCVAAILVAVAFDRPIESLRPDVEYNVDTYLAYCNELFNE